jgi:hypothetical protein
VNRENRNPRRRHCVAATWSREIERRAHEAHANPDDDIAWEVVRAELRTIRTNRQ